MNIPGSLSASEEAGPDVEVAWACDSLMAAVVLAVFGVLPVQESLDFMLPIIDESSSFFSSVWFAVRLPLLMLIVLLVPLLVLDAQDKLFLAAMLTFRVTLMHSLYPFKIGESGSCFGEFVSPLFALLLEDEERKPNRRFSRFVALSVMMIL
jgi:hypothetical protein